jgi:endonuclease/exonuclease/phosphatase family metal-dependent hydrolase
VTDLAKNLNDYAYIGVGRDDGKTKGEYSAIFYKKKKYRVTEQNTFWLSETPEKAGSKSWDAAITRVATWGKFTELSSGKTFFLLNTHFDHVGNVSRAESALLLKKKIAALSGKLPVIVTGDFNCMRDDKPYAVMTSTEYYRLIDPAPENPPGTFCSFKVNSITCRAIDYIFHSPEWKAADYRVIDENNGKYYPSDHLPVVTKLSLR